MVDTLSSITLSSHIQPSSDALTQKLGSEAIVLDTAGERYFGLNEVGTRLWSLLQSDPSLFSAYETLLEEYDVAPASLEDDLISIVRQLAEAGLVTIA